MSRVYMRIFASLMLVVLIVASLGTSIAGAANGTRSISFYADFTSISIAQGEEISLYINIANTGEMAEDIDLTITSPEGWEASITSHAVGSAKVNSLHLEPETDGQRLTFKCVPAADSEEGEYSISLNAVTKDKQVGESIELTIELVGEPAVPSGPGGVELSSNYPNLQGEPGTMLEYKISVTNNLGEDRTFDFLAELPQHLDVSFSPAFDKGKKISALQITADATESIIMSVSIGADVEEGQYPIVFRASSEDVSETVEVEAIITGTHTLALIPDRDVLSASLTAGDETHLFLYVENIGTAPLENVSISATRIPTDWEVTFEPEEVQYLEPGYRQTVDVTVKPPDKAISGDYRVDFSASSGQARDSLIFRMEVESSSSSMIIGIVIVVVVLAVLLLIFLMLRRR